MADVVYMRIKRKVEETRLYMNRYTVRFISKTNDVVKVDPLARDPR